jgi:hypothetical protein
MGPECFAIHPSSDMASTVCFQPHVYINLYAFGIFVGANRIKRAVKHRECKGKCASGESGERAPRVMQDMASVTLPRYVPPSLILARANDSRDYIDSTAHNSYSRILTRARLTALGSKVLVFKLVALLLGQLERYVRTHPLL